MYYLPHHKQTVQQQNIYKLCVKYSSIAMIFLLLLTMASLLMSFVFDAYLPLPTQVASHIATILFSGLFKVAYVVRCIGAYHLGHKSF